MKSENLPATAVESKYLITVLNRHTGGETTFEAESLSLVQNQGRTCRDGCATGYNGQHRLLLKAWRGCERFEDFEAWTPEDIQEEVYYIPCIRVTVDGVNVEDLPKPEKDILQIKMEEAQKEHAEKFREKMDAEFISNIEALHRSLD